MRKIHIFLIVVVALASIILHLPAVASNIFGGLGIETLNLQGKDNLTKTYIADNKLDSNIPNQYTVNLGYLLDADDFRVRFGGKFYTNNPKLIVKQNLYTLTTSINNIYSLTGDLGFRLWRYFAVFFGFEYQLTEIIIKYEYDDDITPIDLYKGIGQTIYAKAGIEIPVSGWQNYEFFVKAPIDSFQRIQNESDVTKSYDFEYGTSVGVAFYMYY